MNDTVIESSMSTSGLRRLHVARMGTPPDVQVWAAQLPENVDRAGILISRYVEDPKGLNMHHLILHWHATEVIRMMPEDRSWAQLSVWWWLGREPGITYYPSVGIDAAASLYRRTLGCWPETAAISNHRQENAKQKVPVSIDVQDGDARVTLPIVQLDWVPERFVVVLGKREALAGGKPMPECALEKADLLVGEGV